MLTNFSLSVFAGNAKTSSAANVRSGAGLSYNVLTTLPGGADIEVTDKISSWYKVNYNGSTGYISDSLVTFNNVAEKDKFSPIKSNYEQLSTYTTRFSTGNADRNHNIELSATKNSIIVKPNEIFSFNKNTGNSTLASNGWRVAGVISNGEYTTGIGGGICQTSSTVHSAVKQLPKLTIVERRPHSIPVGYVPVANEAMVNYGTSDFRFRNTYDFDIYVSNTVNHSAGSITSTIYKIGTEPVKPVAPPVVFNLELDVKEKYVAQLDMYLKNPQEILKILGMFDASNPNQYRVDMSYTIADIDGDKINDLLIYASVFDAHGFEHNQSTFIFTYNNKAVKYVKNITNRENGNMIIKDLSLYKDNSGKNQWFVIDHATRTGTLIGLGFAETVALPLEQLNAIYTPHAFNNENLNSANLDAFKKAKEYEPAVKPKVIVNGRELKYNVPPQNIDDRIYVEMRSLFESLGYAVGYNEETRAVAFAKDDLIYYLDQGFNSKNIRVVNVTSDEEIGVMEITIPIKLVNDRTMFPLRLAGELLDYEVSWSQNLYSAYLDSKVDINATYTEINEIEIEDIEMPVDETDDEQIDEAEEVIDEATETDTDTADGE